jgi:hypothetical protein
MVAAVVLIIVAMVVLAVTRSSTTPETTGGVGSAAWLAEHVPTSVLDRVGAGQGVTPPGALPSGTAPLEERGKPEILYIGAEYCPYCAAERWAMVVALSRFGSFTDLGGTSSSSTDIYPNTQTFTFHGSTYTSSVISFTPVETNTNQPAPGSGFTSLETPTSAEQALFQRYDVPPYTTQSNSTPFSMIGNRFVSVGASYDPAILQGMTRDQIAAALAQPSSPVAQRIDGAANTLTAAICQATGGQPSLVCSDPAIQKISATLPTSP